MAQPAEKRSQERFPEARPPDDPPIDAVEEASRESFPASDAPAWTILPKRADPQEQTSEK